MNLLDTRRLRLLHELSLRGTLAEVADALHQSPSSVSQALTQLEHEVGVPLLEKVGRRVRLTRAAEVLVEHTAVILQRLELAAADVAAVAAQADQASGTVRLAVFQSAASAFMPQMLTALATRHPRLRVTMSQREPEQALYETWMREFDLVIAEEYPGHAARGYPDLDRRPLTTDLLRLAVPPEWDQITTLRDVAESPWTMEPEGTASRHWAEQLCRQAGFEPDVRFVTDDLEAQIALIESGNAVAILPDLMRVRRRPAVRVVDVDPRRRSVFTATRTAVRDTPAIVACREALAAVVPEHLTVT